MGICFEKKNHFRISYVNNFQNAKIVKNIHLENNKDEDFHNKKNPRQSLRFVREENRRVKYIIKTHYQQTNTCRYIPAAGKKTQLAGFRWIV